MSYLGVFYNYNFGGFIPMRGVKYLVVTKNEHGIRLDKWFKNRFPTLRHGVLQKLLRTGQIRINSCRAKGNDRVTVGENIRIPPINLVLFKNANKKMHTPL